MHLIHRQTCRVCGSRALTKVIDLGEQYLQNVFPREDEELPCVRKLPTELVLCDPTQDEKACGLLQTRHTVPPQILYSSYWYKSGVNQTMKDHLCDVVQDCIKHAKRINLGQDITVLDIGCNDGTLLGFWPDPIHKFGVDPSDVAREAFAERKDRTTFISDFFPSDSLPGDTKFDFITAIAMFYDLENPIQFLQNIAEKLKRGGITCIAVSHMPTMLARTSYDTICHEHLEYYSLAVLEQMFTKCGLHIFDASLNEINGGSIRVFASPEKKDESENLRQIRLHEFEMNLDSPETYRQFQHISEVRAHDLLSLLASAAAKGQTVHAYGASTKGNTILQWCKIDRRFVQYAADRNPAKHGCKTPGTNIPIISEEESRGMKPNFYLVLPWSFADEFKEREKEMLAQGTRFIFPLPTIQVVGG